MNRIAMDIIICYQRIIFFNKKFSTFFFDLKAQKRETVISFSTQKRHFEGTSSSFLSNCPHQSCQLLINLNISDYLSSYNSFQIKLYHKGLIILIITSWPQVMFFVILLQYFSILGPPITHQITTILQSKHILSNYVIQLQHTCHLRRLLHPGSFLFWNFFTDSSNSCKSNNSLKIIHFLSFIT